MFDAELGHDDKIAAEARAEPVEGTYVHSDTHILTHMPSFVVY